ncbi:MAG: hypothetical protein ACRELX_16575 [Longimicrobiales bacterium]
MSVLIMIVLIAATIVQLLDIRSRFFMRGNAGFEQDVVGDVASSDTCESAAANAPARDTAAANAGEHVDWRGNVDGTARSRAAIDGGSGYRQPEVAPIIRGDGDHELRRDGRGTLIDRGDLLIMNQHEWRDPVLDGGRIVMRPGARVADTWLDGWPTR